MISRKKHKRLDAVACSSRSSTLSVKSLPERRASGDVGGIARSENRQDTRRRTSSEGRPGETRGAPCSEEEMCPDTGPMTE
ncbi:unnamed protein product [Gadus morhua 'NCC']